MTFTKETTKIMKGLMLTFMFALHFFCSPSFLIDSIDWTDSMGWIAKNLQMPFDICVRVFAFLTGYFYFYNPNKDWKYSARKIFIIMINYWIIYGILLFLAAVTNSYSFEIKSIILEMLGLYRPIMIFCWYVPFYVISMLLLPTVERISKKRNIEWIVYGILLPYFGGILFCKVIRIELIRRVIMDISTYFPVIGIGYLIAKNDVFFRMDRLLKKINGSNNRFFLTSLIWIICFLGQNIIHTGMLSNLLRGGSLFLWYSSIPMFVYCTIKLIEQEHFVALRVIFRELGEKSLPMWFVHCAFFNASKQVFQPILYAPGNIALVLIWGSLVCYLLSCVINCIIKLPIRKLFN